MPQIGVLSALASALVLGLAGAALAFSPGRMVVPPELEAAERAKVSGIGFGRRGKIDVLGHVGHFERSSNRTQILGGVFDSRRGGTRFSVSGPWLSGEAVATCGMRQRSLNLGAIDVGTIPLTYQCDFTEGGAALPDRFEIVENTGFTGILAREERSGRATFGQTTIDIASVHRMRGSPMPIERPIGYLFTRGGKAIGGVETNGGRHVLLAPGLTDAERRAVLLAALALGLFWDPADDLN